MLFQVRAFAETALDTLQKAGASKDGPPPVQRDINAETSSALSALLTLLPEEAAVISAVNPNGPHTPRHPLIGRILDFEATMVADLVHTRQFADGETWNRCVGVYLGPWLPGGAEGGAIFAEAIRAHFSAIDQVSSHNVLPSLICI